MTTKTTTKMLSDKETKELVALINDFDVTEATKYQSDEWRHFSTSLIDIIENAHEAGKLIPRHVVDFLADAEMTLRAYMGRLLVAQDAVGHMLRAEDEEILGEDIDQGVCALRFFLDYRKKLLGEKMAPDGQPYVPDEAAGR
jgi:hypothetical protein